MNEGWRYDEVETGTPDAFPWPPPEGGSVLGAFGETWKSACLDPTGFFRRLPRSSGTGPALLYYLVIGLLVAGANLFWEMLGNATGAGDETLAEMGAAVSPVVTFLLSPLLLVFALVLAAGIAHLALLLLRGATHGFDTSMRVFAYAYSPMILGIVPLIGTVVGTVWMLWIAIVGLREAQETVTWKPAVAVILPFLLLMGAAAFALLTLLAGSALLA
jgi:hypothetical protein